MSDSTKFDCVVIDEAQKIKNRHSGVSKAVRQLQPKYRWALTGTPIENSTKDVITIFEFVKPGLFQASMNYSPQEIKKLIDPHMLRRLKMSVLKDLPDKIREEKWLDLDSKQKCEYEAALAQGRRELSTYADTKSYGELRTHIFTLLHQLK
jgi:SNF2 family DNA or RNA helicase